MPQAKPFQDIQAEIGRLSEIRGQLQSQLAPVHTAARPADTPASAGWVTGSVEGPFKDSFSATISQVETAAVVAQLDRTISNLRRSTREIGQAKADRAKLPRAVLPAQGIPVQKATVLVLFDAGASQAAIEGLLKRYRLHVVRTVPKIGLAVLQANGPTAADGLAAQTAGPEKDLVARLRKEPGVSAAGLNVGLQTSVLPGSSATSGVGPDGREIRWDWADAPGSPSARGLDGNWWQKAIRLPAAWNLLDAIRRRGSAHVKVGVLDVGFAAHEDLSFQIKGDAQPAAADNHGNHVVGIIGARFGNRIGVDGGAPMADIVAAAPQSFEYGADTFLVLSEVVGELVDMIDTNPDMRVINLSLGYNWVANYQRTADTDTEVQRQVTAHGLIVRRVAEMAARHGVVIVAAAGNDSNPVFDIPPVSARYASPFNWAALSSSPAAAPTENIVVVESVGRNRRRSLFSNGGGHVAAPGEAILSTFASIDGEPSPRAYGVESGTSMAAPQATAILALMFAYNPGLTAAQAVAILKRTAMPRSDGAPIVDAFAALLEARPDSLVDLADLNGDGVVDMRDFSLFRLAVRQVEGRSDIPAADLNGDGAISADENVWPRCDLNGSGRLDQADTDARMVRGERMTDLDVMAKAWSDPGTPAQALRALLRQ
ncbi:S8 family serine peptidase [Methylobacterium mesophilicum]|uniref:S8 family serine peptidase n=1 Tax=Methylobacterium mesophilicum TaxID=39956 RepID=UPI002F35DB19